MFLKHFSNGGFLSDSNYAKIIFEKQEQPAIAYAVKNRGRWPSGDALFACLEKLSELESKTNSPELDKEINAVLKQIAAEFLLPGKG